MKFDGDLLGIGTKGICGGGKYERYYIKSQTCCEQKTSMEWKNGYCVFKSQTTNNDSTSAMTT